MAEDETMKNSSDDDEDVLTLRPDSKRPRLDTDFSKCIICQERGKQKVSKATRNGLETFYNATQVRQDDVYERLGSDLDTLIQGNVFWHRNCYQCYTSRTNLEPFQKAKSTSNPTEDPTEEDDSDVGQCRRSCTPALDWARCMFCQQRTYKNDKVLHQVMTYDAERSIRDAVDTTSDISLRVKITGVDLIAQEAKYHRQCYIRYILRAKRQECNTSDDESEIQFATKYQEGFQQLIDEIDFPLIQQRKALDMTTLLNRFYDIMAREVPDIVNYRSEKLKRRLMNHYGEAIVFQSQRNPNQSELVYSSAVSLQDAINVASSMKGRLGDASGTSADDDQNQARTLFHAALFLRKELKGCTGLTTKPVNPNDVTLERAMDMVPDSVYMFLKWVIEGHDEEVGGISLEKTPSVNGSIHRQIISASQDLIHTSSAGKTVTPKHLGLAVTIKHRTGSKLVVTMLNRAGHCISYDELQRIDTATAYDIIQKSQEHGVVLPSNIRHGIFIHAAADNIDVNEETLDGKATMHATSMVLYQRSVLTDGDFGTAVDRIQSAVSTKERRRTLQEKVMGTEIAEFSVSGRRPSPIFTGKINLDWFHAQRAAQEESQNLDFAWMIVRLCPHKLFEVNLERDPKLQQVFGWSAYNALVSRKVVSPTSIGYCPLINASPTEYSTVYTVMSTLQKMMSAFNQEKTVITFDEAIYSKAKEIQWRVPDQFDDVILRMGGFHIALNFLATIGHLYEESGFEDLLIESSVYGSSSVTKIIKGKMYNRGVRAHKLVVEALMRLRWAAFCQWLGDKGLINDKNVVVFDQTLKELQDVIANEELENIQAATEDLTTSLSDLQVQMKDFVTEGRRKSQTFAHKCSSAVPRR